MSEENIKPCPFCKKPQKYPEGDDYWKIINGEKDEDSGWSAQYECPFCYAAGPFVSGYSDEKSAIDAALYAWNNQRAEPREIPEWLIKAIKSLTIRYSTSSSGVRGYNRALKHVLSLKKPEEIPCEDRGEA